MNVNMESCPNHFAQYGALEALTGDQAGPREMMARLKGRRDAALRILNETPGVRCHTPESTFYLYPDVTGAVRLTGCAGHEDFRRLLLDKTGVSFCTRLHFGKAVPGENRVPSPSGVFRRHHRTDRGGPRRVQGLHRVDRARRVLDPPRRHRDDRPARPASRAASRCSRTRSAR